MYTGRFRLRHSCVMYRLWGLRSGLPLVTIHFGARFRMRSHKRSMYIRNCNIVKRNLQYLWFSLCSFGWFLKSALPRWSQKMFTAVSSFTVLRSQFDKLFSTDYFFSDFLDECSNILYTLKWPITDVCTQIFVSDDSLLKGVRWDLSQHHPSRKIPLLTSWTSLLPFPKRIHKYSCSVST